MDYKKEARRGWEQFNYAGNASVNRELVQVRRGKSLKPLIVNSMTLYSLGYYLVLHYFK